MSTPHWKHATALVPLAVLSGGWSVLMAVSSAGASSDVEPSGVTPPVEAIEAPASVSPARGLAAAVPSPRGYSTHGYRTSTVSSTGIPAAALAAYQRAAQVMGTTDPGCRLAWPLLAAIGRVESDHGRFGGSVLSADGVARPGIVGIPLNGANGTASIADTDAGTYDGDARFDRAVGPMQFIPSTWSVVGVDGDGDQQRNPQDIDDAALAAAVYLCSGKEDLSTESGVTSAVYRYNHSHDYVTLVKSLADGYAEGGYSTVPTATYSTVSLSPSYGSSAFDIRKTGDHKTKPEPKPAADVHDLPTTPPPSQPEPVEEEPAREQPEKKAGLAETVAELPQVIEETVTDTIEGLGLEPLLGGLLKP